MEELEALKAFCGEKGLDTKISESNGKYYLVDSQFKYCFVDSLGNNFYKIIATELTFDENDGIAEQSVESGKLYIDDAYSFMDGIIKDNEALKSRV